MDKKFESDYSILPTRRVGQVQEQLSISSDLTVDIHNLITDLEEKLHTVLSPKFEEDSINKESVPLAEAFRTINSNAHSAVYRLKELLGRIDI